MLPAGSHTLNHQMPMTVVKIDRGSQMALPTRPRVMRGIAEGDEVEIDQSKFPTAEDKCTPGRLRIIDARLDESGQDFKRVILCARSVASGEMLAGIKARLRM